ncbi:glycosyl transferase [Desulfopila sp. IMCC35006]|uniref:glycosyl transferase n=1 Tax=Desulfopila sp. IMCC35006 TaxID=2569542 RepID=UPI0010AD90D3|nr:glycosyl transferase [Desulfopila sp. IMCC35006]TKB26115.1 glycosyl transferase [Desulfopila sp. IMCC35006]
MNQFRSILVLLMLACGVLTTLWGFSQMAWPSASASAWASVGRYVVFLLMGLSAAVLASRCFKVSYLIVAAFICGGIALLTDATWPLFVTIWFWLSSYGLGDIVLKGLKIDPKEISAIYIALIGSVIYGTTVGIISHYPINYPGLYGIALALPLILRWQSISETILLVYSRLLIKERSNFTELLFVVLALFYFSVALMPEVGHDALAMHLFVPAHLSLRHEWSFDVTKYVWAVMPMMGDWLFSIAYMLGGESAARLINVSFIFVLCRLVRDLVIWAGGNAVGARWSVLLFLATPLTFTESSSLFIESVWASFIISGSLSIFKLLQSTEDKKKQLLISGFLLGGALATKAVTFTILPVFMILLVYCYRSWLHRNLIGSIALGLFFFLAIGAVPYATAWHLTANPVFPFFNNIFKSPFWLAVAFDSSSIFGKGLTWDVLYQATFNTQKFMECHPGAAGFQWLVLLVPSFFALVFRRQFKGTLLFVVAGFSIFLAFQSVAYLRYIFPSFAWVAAGIGVMLSTKQTDSIEDRIMPVAVLAVVLLNLLFFRAGTYYGDLSLQPLLSHTGRETYLNNRLPIRNAVKLVNELNIGRTPVAVFSSPLTAGIDSDVLYPNWYNYQFQAKVSDAKTADDIAHLLIEKEVDYVILDSNWGSTDKKMFIEGATEKLAEVGAISIRKLDNRYRFKKELLKDPDLSTKDGWVLPTNESEKYNGILTVSVSAPAYQIVPVRPGRRYKNSITARCAIQPSQGRMQVNWLDSKSNFISTDIQVFGCTMSDTTYTMEVVAPSKSVKAVVYASSHTNIPIIFNRVSFK